MEAIPVQPRCTLGPRDRERPRDVGHAGVEHGIETSDLRTSRVARGRGRQQCQRRGHVERCERLSLFQLSDHLSIDLAMPQQLRSAMHDAMPDRDRRRRTGLRQRRVDRRECGVAIGRIDLSRHDRRQVRRGQVERRELQRRRSAVKHQRNPTLDHAGQRQSRTSGMSSPFSAM